MSRMDCYKSENQTPARALQEARDAIKAVRKAFGPAGDYGYGTPQGDALHWLYDSLNLIVPAAKKAGDPQQETCGFCQGRGVVPGPTHDREGRHRPEWPPAIPCEYCNGSGTCEEGSKLLPARRPTRDD